MELEGETRGRGVAEHVFKTYPDLRVDWRIKSMEPVPGEKGSVAVTIRNRLLATGPERPVHVKYVVGGGKIRAFHHL